MNDAFSEPSSFPRVATGIPGLDTLTKGGLLLGGLYLFYGQPGSGKTILGNQMCFHHMRGGERAAYVTLLTESHARMLQHIRSFSFFDPQAIGDSLYYVSGYSMLQSNGLDGLLEMLQNVIRDQSATLLVIDGVSTVRDFPASENSIKAFLQKLHLYAEAHNCTTIMLSQAGAGDKSGPEYTMVDGLVELNSRYNGLRTLLEIEVSKLRGTDYIRGRHTYQIASDGLAVYPRTEALLRTLQATTPRERTRMSFGIEDLDNMLQGGVLSGSTTLLYGVPGTGKTMMGLHFLAEGARKGEAGLYFGFYETSERLIANAQGIGLDFASYTSGGQIQLLWQPPLEGMLDLLGQRLMEAVRQRNVKRLFIDGLSGLEKADYPDRVPQYLVAISNELRALDVTTLLSVELHDLISASVSLPVPVASAVADNVILLRFVELRSQLYRLLSLTKVRESAYDSSVREFYIDATGVHVAHTFGSAEAILTGAARPSKPEMEAEGDDNR
jgi:circadian clock protein KaiC